MNGIPRKLDNKINAESVFLASHSISLFDLFFYFTVQFLTLNVTNYYLLLIVEIHFYQFQKFKNDLMKNLWKTFNKWREKIGRTSNIEDNDLW